MIRTRVPALSAMLLAASFALFADEPSVEEMIDALAPKPTTPLTRGLSRGMKPAPQVREGRLQLSVQFDYASASLTPEGRDLLTRLATAMKSPNLSQLRYRIEGHTDSSGDPQRNQNLSERRAATVAKFLSSSTGIEAQRMNRVGLGSTVPANEVDSKAAENRRVVIVSLEAGEAPPAAEAKAQKGGGVVQPVLDGSCRVGVIGSLPIVPEEFVSEHLLHVPFATVVAPQHPLAKSRRKRLRSSKRMSLGSVPRYRSS